MKFLKEYAIVIIILLIIISIEIVTQKYLNNSIDWMNSEISNLENKINENKMDEAKKDFYNIKNEWQDKENKLSIFVEHGELEKVSKNMAVIEATFLRNDNDQNVESIFELRFVLNHIKEKSRLKLKNIF